MLRIRRSGVAGVLTAVMLSLAASAVHAEDFYAESRPSDMAMMGDALIGRPLLLGATVLGTAAFVVSLPFSLIGGNVSEVADTLVGKPARATFVRCLGCTPSQDAQRRAAARMAEVNR